MPPEFPVSITTSRQRDFLKDSLERAAREAGRGLIDTDHLLLGMLNVRDALAVETLRSLGVTPDAVRTSLLAHRAQAS